jgi:hypothetical protein
MKLLLATAITLIAGSVSAQGSAACPFSPDDINKTLGSKVNAATVRELPFSGGKMVSCQYNPINLTAAGQIAVTLSMIVMTPQGFEQTKKYRSAASNQSLAGKMEMIAGDPELAGWQVGQGDLTNVTLVYYRNNSETSVRVTGVDMKNAAAVKAMREKVLKLKRVP